MLINHAPLKFDSETPEIHGNAFYNAEEIPNLENYNKIVLEFWRLGCRKCHTSLEEVQQMSETASKETLFLAVHHPEMPFEKDPQRLEDFLEEHKITLPVLVDQDGYTAQNFGVHIHPTRIVLERGKEYKLGS